MKDKDFDAEKLKESGQVFMAQLSIMSKKLRTHMESISGSDAKKFGISQSEIQSKVNQLNGELSKLKQKLDNL